jgi:hypothetical protein
LTIGSTSMETEYRQGLYEWIHLMHSELPGALVLQTGDRFSY